MSDFGGRDNNENGNVVNVLRIKLYTNLDFIYVIYQYKI